MIRSLVTHAAHDTLSGSHHHYARHATMAVRPLIGEDKYHRARWEHTDANKAKHGGGTRSRPSRANERRLAGLQRAASTSETVLAAASAQQASSAVADDWRQEVAAQITALQRELRKTVVDAAVREQVMASTVAQWRDSLRQELQQHRMDVLALHEATAQKCERMVAAGASSCDADTFTSVYVKNLPGDADEGQLRARFAGYGSILSACILEDKQGRKFAFVNYGDHAAAKRAVDEQHGKDLRTAEQKACTKEDADPESYLLYVQRAQTKAERSRELRKLYLARASTTVTTGKPAGTNLHVKHLDETAATTRARCQERLEQRYSSGLAGPMGRMDVDSGNDKDFDGGTNEGDRDGCKGQSLDRRDGMNFGGGKGFMCGGMDMSEGMMGCNPTATSCNDGAPTTEAPMITEYQRMIEAEAEARALPGAEELQPVEEGEVAATASRSIHEAAHEEAALGAQEPERKLRGDHEEMTVQQAIARSRDRSAPQLVVRWQDPIAIEYEAVAETEIAAQAAGVPSLFGIAPLQLDADGRLHGFDTSQARKLLPPPPPQAPVLPAAAPQVVDQVTEVEYATPAFTPTVDGLTFQQALQLGWGEVQARALFEGVAKTSRDPEPQCMDHARHARDAPGLVPSDPKRAVPEMRQADDGKWYSWQDFVVYYGATGASAKWGAAAAPRVSSSHRDLRGQSRGCVGRFPAAALAMSVPKADVFEKLHATCEDLQASARPHGREWWPPPPPPPLTAPWRPRITSEEGEATGVRAVLTTPPPQEPINPYIGSPATNPYLAVEPKQVQKAGALFALFPGTPATNPYMAKQVQKT